MIEWEDKFSVGISMIDEEHKTLIGILNKAIIAKEHNANTEEIKEVLREMNNYTIYRISFHSDIKPSFDGHAFHIWSFFLPGGKDMNFSAAFTQISNLVFWMALQ